MQINPFLGKTVRWAFKNFFFVCYSPMGFMNGSSIGCQSQAIQGPVPQVAAQNLGCRHVYRLLPERYW